MFYVYNVLKGSKPLLFVNRIVPSVVGRCMRRNPAFKMPELHWVKNEIRHPPLRQALVSGIAIYGFHIAFAKVNKSVALVLMLVSSQVVVLR